VLLWTASLLLLINGITVFSKKKHANLYLIVLNQSFALLIHDVYRDRNRIRRSQTWRPTFGLDKTPSPFLKKGANYELEGRSKLRARWLYLRATLAGPPNMVKPIIFFEGLQIP
jgi:hypothetical protein